MNAPDLNPVQRRYRDAVIMGSAITVERVECASIVRRMICAADSYSAQAEDGFPPAEAYEPDMSGRCLYLLASRLDAELGLFILEPSSVTTWIFHATVLPPARGTWGVAAGLASHAWLIANTRVDKLLAWVPQHRPAVYAYARRLGFGALAIDHGSIRIGNTRRDRIIMEKSLCLA